MSLLLTAGSNQLGPVQLVGYLLNRQERRQLGQLAFPLSCVFNQDTSEAIASVGRVPSANTVENVLLDVSNLSGRNVASNIRENVLLSDSNAIVALDFFESLQQQGLP
eukprot:5345903-Ditylum_brightwellii.AAC.1